MKKSSKIVHIGQESDNSFSFSPVQLLQSVVEEIERGDLPAKRVLVLLLNDPEEDTYDVEIRMGQLRDSDAVALMTFAQHILLSDMYQGKP